MVKNYTTEDWIAGSSIEYTGLDDELMTGIVEDETSSTQGDMPISRITIGMLQDLNYQVDYSAAD